MWEGTVIRLCAVASRSWKPNSWGGSTPPTVHNPECSIRGDRKWTNGWMPLAHFTHNGCFPPNLYSIVQKLCGKRVHHIINKTQHPSLSLLFLLMQSMSFAANSLDDTEQWQRTEVVASRKTSTYTGENWSPSKGLCIVQLLCRGLQFQFSTEMNNQGPPTLCKRKNQASQCCLFAKPRTSPNSPLLFGGNAIVKMFQARVLKMCFCSTNDDAARWCTSLLLTKHYSQCLQSANNELDVPSNILASTSHRVTCKHCSRQNKNYSPRGSPS